MQNLIYRLSKENPLWSAERIRDTLLLLSYDPPCDDTIGKYMYTPLMNWVIRQRRESMPFGLQPKYLFRDNDSIYGNGVRAFLESCGITEVRTAYRSPWQNPFVERFIGTLRRELLDHVIVFSQSHLERPLREFIEEYYHVGRLHQGLDGDTPVLQTKQPKISGLNKLISIAIVGGLHHRYVRVAA